MNFTKLQRVTINKEIMENNFNWKRLLSPNEEEYRWECLVQMRWNGTPTCTHCKNTNKIYFQKKRKLFRCSKCDKQFSVTSGTNLHSTKLSLLTWFQGLHQFNIHSISSYNLAEYLDVSQPTAWRMGHKFRMGMSNSKHFKGKLEGTIELDETFVGGKNKNRHWNKKVKNNQGRALIDKVGVFGMLNRHGKLFVWTMGNLEGKGLKALVRSKVEEGSNVASDEYRGYNGLHRQFNHGRVLHRKHNYVKGECHTNTLEGFWNLLKKTVMGIHFGVVKKWYLQRYCKEVAYRYVTRKYLKYDRMEEILTDCLFGRYANKGLYL